MGYYNPIYIYGVDKFLIDAKSAGVDGLIIVDLPPEEDTELCLPAMKAGLNFIRLATPTTDDKRLPAVLANTSGFVYYVSITGITGSASADSTVVGEAVARIKRHTKLPVCVGFGIRTAGSRARHRRACRRRGGRHRAGRCLARQPRFGRPGDRRNRRCGGGSCRGAGAGCAGSQAGRGISHNCRRDSLQVAACRALPEPPYIAGDLIAIRSEE